MALKGLGGRIVCVLRPQLMEAQAEHAPKALAVRVKIARFSDGYGLKSMALDFELQDLSYFSGFQVFAL